MMKWATVSNGKARRISSTKPHPDALPVVYDPPDVDRIENDLRQKPVSEWAVGSESVTVTYNVTPRDLSSEKKAAKDRARAERWEAEQCGLEFQGHTICTDEKSQGRVAAMVTTILADPDLASVDFEAQPGEWVTLDRDDALALGKLVSGHVQACFSHCRAMHDQIEGCETVADVWGVNIRSGWPGEFNDSET